MCMSKTVTRATGQPDAIRAASMLSTPWRRIFRQNLKPKLSRNIVSSARVNLNRYWNKFEELATSSRSVMVLLPSANNPSVDNEMNDNFVNELQEDQEQQESLGAAMFLNFLNQDR